MALSEKLILGYLLQEAQAVNPALVWTELSDGGFRTDINGVSVELSEVPTRAGSYLSLSFSAPSLGTVFVQEPQTTSLFGRKYKDDDARDLAMLMRQLKRLAEEQCEERRVRAIERKDEIRQMLFHRILFGSREPVTSDTR